jgi:hypothetical protein
MSSIHVNKNNLIDRLGLFQGPSGAAEATILTLVIIVTVVVDVEVPTKTLKDFEVKTLFIIYII